MKNGRINKKEKNLARRSALSIKVSSSSFKILDNIKIDNPKTKNLIDVLDNLKIVKGKTTIMVGKSTENLYLSSRNVHNINLVSTDTFSTYDIMNSDFILFDKESIEVLNNKL